MVRECRAAGKGLAVAQYNLGCMLRNGHGVQKNSREAEAWFREAAQQGYTDARLMLRAISYDRRILEAQSYWEPQETPISSWDEPSQDDGYCDNPDEVPEADHLQHLREVSHPLCEVFKKLE